MANYSRDYNVVLTEKKVLYGETPIVFKEGDKGSFITAFIKKENKIFDTTGLEPKFFCKDENGVVYAIEDAVNFVNGGTTGEIKIILTEEILAVPSKFVGQLELHDADSIYTFELVDFTVENKLFND